MEKQKKKRGENWTAEEKEILRQLIAQSADIIEDKSTKTNTNTLKIKEWKNITIKFNELTGKTRSDVELKLAWKRMKLSAKSNISAHRRELKKTGGGEKPPSPTPEDLAIVAIAPHDFVIEVNDFDSDAILITTATTNNKEINIDPYIDPKLGPSNEQIKFNEINEEDPEHSLVEVQGIPDITIRDTETVPRDRVIMTNNETVDTSRAAKPKKKNLQNRSDDMRQSIIQSNTDFKKRQLEMMEVEHRYHIEIAKLKIKKMELEIALLESKENTSTEE